MDMDIKSIRDAFVQGLTAGLPNLSGQGDRMIVLHIGDEVGFRLSGDEIFQSKV